MKRAELSVSPDLVELTAIKQLAGNHSIRLVEERWWQQLWAVYFLDPVPTLPDNPSGYFWIPTGPPTGPPASPNVLILVSKSPDASSTKYFSLPQRRVLWQNSTYLLLGPGPQ
jgi:hypothetical protein